MAGTAIGVEGLDECLRALNGLTGELRKNANGELRKASRAIAADIVPLLGGSGSPQEAAILAAAGPKSDRYVVVAIPARKPALSGLKRTPAAQAKRLAWALETGSDWPAFRGPAAGSLVSTHRNTIARMAIPRYTAALTDIMRRYGLL
jgi:hypothetical protein